MSKSVEVKLNKDGVSELMKSSEIQEALTEVGQGIMGRLPDGYQMDEPYIGKTRANVMIHATTAKAMADNMKHNTLLKALGGGK